MLIFPYILSAFAFITCRLMDLLIYLLTCLLTNLFTGTQPYRIIMCQRHQQIVFNFAHNLHNHTDSIIISLSDNK